MPRVTDFSLMCSYSNYITEDPFGALLFNYPRVGCHQTKSPRGRHIYFQLRFRRGMWTVRAAQLREACAAIRGATLHSFLAHHFCNLHVAHHPAHPPKERFVRDLNYNWLQYTFAADAAVLFWKNFDERASEQEATYRSDQQAAKRAGKGKTRHFRLALPLHNLLQAFKPPVQCRF